MLRLRFGAIVALCGQRCHLVEGSARWRRCTMITVLAADGSTVEVHLFCYVDFITVALVHSSRAVGIVTGSFSTAAIGVLCVDGTGQQDDRCGPLFQWYFNDDHGWVCNGSRGDNAALSAATGGVILCVCWTYHVGTNGRRAGGILQLTSNGNVTSSILVCGEWPDWPVSDHSGRHVRNLHALDRQDLTRMCMIVSSALCHSRSREQSFRCITSKY
jgi:hypothetical protein